jgi:hypothetical protein
MASADATSIVVGDRASFEAARGATGGGVTAAAGGAEEASLARLDLDTSAFAHDEHALAQFTTDAMGVRGSVGGVA